MIGERILNYQIDKLLGEGGIGKVYLATHTQLERKVAIKALNEHLVNNADIRQRFRQEAATLSNLQHLNIVTLYDYVEEERGLFLIMEYADGQPLEDYIQQVSGPIPEEKAIPIFAKILEGLQYAHQQGVVHRDIKPSNIIINPPENVKILDFGIAKILTTENPQLTKTGTALGTVLYMSPEQVQGKPLDHRSDIYSLGVTLFEMLTGKAPYPKNAASEFEIYQKILQEPLPRAKQFYPPVSDKMQLIIDKATAKDPEKRFKDCEEFRKALIGELTLRAVPKQEATPIPANNTQPALEKTKIATPTPTAKKRNFTLAYVAIGILIFTIGFFVWSKIAEYENRKDDPIPDNFDTSTVAEEKKDFINDDEKIEVKEKTPEERTLDSLAKEKKRREESIENFYKQQNESLRSNLVVDGQFMDNELGLFRIQVNVINKSASVKFDNLTIIITYANENGETIETKERFYGAVSASHNESFTVEQEIDAAKFTCSYKAEELEITNLKPDALPDSLETLQKEIKEIEEAIEEVKKKQEESKEKDAEAKKEETE